MHPSGREAPDDECRRPSEPREQASRDAAPSETDCLGARLLVVEPLQAPAAVAKLDINRPTSRRVRARDPPVVHRYFAGSRHNSSLRGGPHPLAQSALGESCELLICACGELRHRCDAATCREAQGDSRQPKPPGTGPPSDPPPRRSLSRDQPRKRGHNRFRGRAPVGVAPRCAGDAQTRHHEHC
jgi:hypothetical protein